MTRLLAAALIATLLAGRAAAEVGVDAIIALFPPRLAEVVRPAPPLPDASMQSKLRWMAELGHRVDARWQHSRSDAWRSVMGWPEASDEGGLWPPSPAPDLGVERYPVPRGRDDPAVDFAASVALVWLDPLHFSCDFPLRARFLRDAGLAPPGPLPIEAGKCRAFEAWAELATIDAVDVIYVAQRWQDAAATMGHVLFRVRRAGPQQVIGPSFETVFSYIAKDSIDTPGYVFKGMIGELTAGVKLDYFGDIWARYGVREGRDMHVFELRLDADERRFLLAEVFAQRRHGMAVPYAFFSTNCATLAWDTLRAVLPELPRHEGLLVHPHEVPSMLLAAERARARGVVPAVRTLAKRAEVLREELAAELVELPRFLATHALRWDDVTTRAEALHALRVSVSAGHLSEPTRRSLAAWTDTVLDIEAFAIDRANHGYVPGATSPALEAALDLRAELPPPTTVVAPFEPAPVGPSGSRRAEVVVGAIDTLGTPRAALTWTTSVLAEAIGEPRQAVLARGSRMRLLVNELTLSSGGDGIAIERERLVVVDSATYADGVRTDQSWLAAHLGFAFGCELMIAPRAGLPFAMQASLGPTLTLAASADFSDYLALESDVRLATWTRVDDGDAAFRSTLGLALALGVALGDPHRLRARYRVAPGLDLGGFALEHDATIAFDFALGGRWFFIMRGAYRRGLPVGDGLEATLGLAY